MHPRPLTLLYASLLIQLGAVIYSPLHQLPTAADTAAGEQLRGRLASIPGEVYMPSHGYLPSSVGKRPYAHTMAVADVCRAYHLPEARDLSAEIEVAIAQKHFAAIILDEPDDTVPVGIESYRSAGNMFGDSHVFFPVTGLPTRPQRIFFPHE